MVVVETSREKKLKGQPVYFCDETGLPTQVKGKLENPIEAHGLMHLALLLDVMNRNQWCSLGLDCNLLI